MRGMQIEVYREHGFFKPKAKRALEEVSVQPRAPVFQARLLVMTPLACLIIERNRLRAFTGSQIAEECNCS